MSTSYEAIALGELPVDKINAVLGTELEPGLVRLSRSAHRHIAEDHPGDYATCLAALPEAIRSPSFIGQAPKHPNNFELVRRMNRPDGKEVLAAVGLEPDASGSYRVVSCYLIRGDTVTERRIAGRLKPPPP